MRVVVDTSIWSLAFRRTRTNLSPKEVELVEELKRLIRTGEVILLGVVRQEALSGIRDARKFEKLCEDLRAFDDCELQVEDYETAATVFNSCRNQGISGSVVDMLICGVALRRNWSVFSSDPDFAKYAKWVPLQLHRADS